jgi:3-oxoacyl-[acyl-carrier protein] reductase
MRETGLKNKVVLVTGAVAGIGRATALRFAEEGARVAAWDVDDHGADLLLGEISNLGGQGRFEKVNVTDAKSVDDGVREIVAAWGRLDVLVNNAGITRDAQLIRWKDGAEAGAMDDAAFDAVIGVNLKGVFHCTRGVVPQMIKQGGGVILNASSVVAIYGNFGQTNYVATKAGVIGMTRTWARELGKYQIRVNAVAPGFIATEMMRAMPEKVIETMKSHTPLGCMGEPDDIAETYAWLASDRARFVHGAVISVDGGIVLGT